MHQEISRREMIALSGAAIGAALTGGIALAKEDLPMKGQFRFCLNMSTLQEPWGKDRKISVPEEIDIAGKAGYDAVELWVNEIDDYVKSGGSLKDLAKRIRDNGLVVADGIGFAEWIVDDDARRAKAMERAKHEMDLLAQLGCPYIAAPPAGATNQTDLSYAKIAERYRALLDLGDAMGVVPQVELWGFSKVLSRIGECAHVAIESGHKKACILLDVYHIYKGGSDFTGVNLLNAGALHIIHTNDYPAAPPRAEINDSHRIYPGDGIAPLPALFRDLRAIGYRGVLSIELFNRGYWQQDPHTVAKTALEKTRAAVKQALG